LFKTARTIIIFNVEIPHMDNDIRIAFDGQEYTLAPKTITGELIDAVTPIRARMKQYSQGLTLIEAALNNDELFELIDPRTGNLRPGVSEEALRAVALKDRELMKLIAMPTIALTTDANGRMLMAEIIQVTVDRTGLPEALCEAIDSQHYTAPASDGPKKKTKAVAMSQFWAQFPVDKMIDYVETFCRRARI
jgi:hypothetical protein